MVLPSSCKQRPWVLPMIRIGLGLALLLMLPVLGPGPATAAAGEDLQIEVKKKDLGKEVVIRQGEKEWFMMIEVTPADTVIIRQEIDQGQYLVDESETHDRAMSPAEVDRAIEDFINSVKMRAKTK